MGNVPVFRTAWEKNVEMMAVGESAANALRELNACSFRANVSPTARIRNVGTMDVAGTAEIALKTTSVRMGNASVNRTALTNNAGTMDVGETADNAQKILCARMGNACFHATTALQWITAVGRIFKGTHIITAVINKTGGPRNQPVRNMTLIL